MKIKVTINNKIQEINLDGIPISLTELKIGNDIYFKDIQEISFDENNFFMQMVDSLKDCCIISYQENGNKIKLSTYKA